MERLIETIQETAMRAAARRVNVLGVEADIPLASKICGRIGEGLKKGIRQALAEAKEALDAFCDQGQMAKTSILTWAAQVGIEAVDKELAERRLLSREKMN